MMNFLHPFTFLLVLVAGSREKGVLFGTSACHTDIMSFACPFLLVTTGITTEYDVYVSSSRID